VHEQAVVCPHCGEPTGVPADPIAELEIAQLEPVEEANPVLPLALEPSTPAPELPRAIARRRRRTMPS